MNDYQRIILKQQIEAELKKLQPELEKLRYGIRTVSKEATVQSKARESIDQDDSVKAMIESKFSKIVGLNNIKKELISFANYLVVQKERNRRGYTTSSIPLHAVFSGSPGTGKTTVARILGKIYKKLKILKKGHVVEVDRGDLVAGYIGQTTMKTKEILKKSLDGILFIDEAYSLSKCQSDEKDFGKEAIETILKFMEDNRDRISIIVAGYKENMQQFINSNPGLNSRFTKFYRFADFTPKELCEIFNINAKQENYKTRDHAFKFISYFIKEFKRKSDPNTFGNGRSIRNIFEDLKLIQSDRIAKIENFYEVSDSVLEYFLLKDIKELFIKHDIVLPQNAYLV